MDEGGGGEGGGGDSGGGWGGGGRSSAGAASGAFGGNFGMGGSSPIGGPGGWGGAFGGARGGNGVYTYGMQPGFGQTVSSLLSNYGSKAPGAYGLLAGALGWGIGKASGPGGYSGGWGGGHSGQGAGGPGSGPGGGGGGGSAGRGAAGIPPAPAPAPPVYTPPPGAPTGPTDMTTSTGGTKLDTAALDPWSQYRSGIMEKLNAMVQPGYKFQSDDPSYQARLNEGSGNLARQMAAMGLQGSGNEMAALQEYGQKFASQEYQNQFQRLAGLAELGSPLGAAQVGIQNEQLGLQRKQLEMQAQAYKDQQRGERNAGIGTAIGQVGELGGGWNNIIKGIGGWLGGDSGDSDGFDWLGGGSGSTNTDVNPWGVYDWFS